jgi:hypothetical protein
VPYNTHLDGMPCQDSNVCRERDVPLLGLEMLLEVSLCEVVKEFEDRILENVKLGKEAGKAVIPRAPAVVLRNVKPSVRRTPMTFAEREGASHDL